MLKKYNNRYRHAVRDISLAIIIFLVLLTILFDLNTTITYHNYDSVLGTVKLALPFFTSLFVWFGLSRKQDADNQNLKASAQKCLLYLDLHCSRPNSFTFESVIATFSDLNSNCIKYFIDDRFKGKKTKIIGKQNSTELNNLRFCNIILFKKHLKRDLKNLGLID